MRATLLCPGPSLGKTFPPGRNGYELIVGVNRAAQYTPCDWWAALDGDFVRSQHRNNLGTPKLLSREYVLFAEDSHEWLIDLENSLTLEVVASDTPAVRIGRVGQFTAPAALLLCGYLGATSIDVYGADLAGTTDFDGHAPPDAWRTDERWRREQTIWSLMRINLARRKIPTHFIRQPHGPV